MWGQGWVPEPHPRPRALLTSEPGAAGSCACGRAGAAPRPCGLPEGLTSLQTLHSPRDRARGRDPRVVEGSWAGLVPASLGSSSPALPGAGPEHLRDLLGEEEPQVPLWGSGRAGATPLPLQPRAPRYLRAEQGGWLRPRPLSKGSSPRAPHPSGCCLLGSVESHKQWSIPAPMISPAHQDGFNPLWPCSCAGRAAGRQGRAAAGARRWGLGADPALDQQQVPETSLKCNFCPLRAGNRSQRLQSALKLISEALEGCKVLAVIY